MPLLGPLLGIRLLEQKFLKSVTECYQSFGQGDVIRYAVPYSWTGNTECPATDGRQLYERYV